MKYTVEFLKVPLKNRSVLASGILGVTIASLRRVYSQGAGIVTTKSVGPVKRKGHNAPVVFDWGGGLINAVGLSNPGIDDFVRQYDNDCIDFPIIISLYGEDEGDFSHLAEKLNTLKYTFLEINLSCPNVMDEFGAPFSFSPDLTSRITRNVRDTVDTPVIVKLSPNAPDLVRVACSAEDAGADALCIANTVGPGMVINTNTGAPILGNRTGGISGEAVLPLTVRNIYELYREVHIPLIGTGGIDDADGALQVLMAGAQLYGIGSAVYTKGLEVFREIDSSIREFMDKNHMHGPGELIGLSHKKRKFSFYHTVKSDMRAASSMNRPQFLVFPVQEIEQGKNEGVKTIFFKVDELNSEETYHSGSLQAKKSFLRPEPGQFYMLWLPGVDQKPYSVSYCSGAILGFSLMKRGRFSELLFKVRRGDAVGLLGPLGRGFDLAHDHYLLVGGGIGCAPLIFAAIELKKAGRQFTLLAGGKTGNSLHWMKPLLGRGVLDDTSRILYCTEDGSSGFRGMITDHLEEVIERVNPEYALVCGPELCIRESLRVFRECGIPGEAGIERMMKCGIGICGSCSVDPKGDRVCVEGPVFSFQELEKMEEFGKYRRDESGTILKDV